MALRFKTISTLVKYFKGEISPRWFNFKNTIELSGFMLTNPLVKDYGKGKLSCVFTITQINRTPQPYNSKQYKTFTLRTSSKTIIEKLRGVSCACFVIALGKLTRNDKQRAMQFHITALEVAQEYPDFALVEPKYTKGE